ncbi:MULTISPECIES: DUF2306 domain-containing protein [Bacillus]|uniref:Uncharacterized membrane protein YozB (DUF420 family) n=1 Tax=Bacillus capparidis TaxID=1840411 RepID=A0ABS4D1K0_9BACI|nr:MULTISPECIES: DUF2306 domain-containing protein [Bacillus]MBP1083453.1 uncharacterized membrane protein YozB (DUF420 family) [Bacillus capparidis]MED1097885.1 DUF2306 domain-containing protein [Bacillus capparidis]
MKSLSKGLNIFLFIISVMWVLHTFSKNFMIDPNFERFLSRKDFPIQNEGLWILMIRIHIVLALIALLTGPVALIKRIRVKRLPVHRWFGRIYVLSIILNYIPGLYVSLFATGGLLSTAGFFILNTLWLCTTLIGYRAIRKKRMIPHSQWMLRSFFLSFANMTIYIIVAIFHNALNFPYAYSYTMASWMCWILNLLLAEMIIKKNLNVKRAAH